MYIFSSDNNFVVVVGLLLYYVVYISRSSTMIIRLNQCTHSNVCIYKEENTK